MSTRTYESEWNTQYDAKDFGEHFDFSEVNPEGQVALAAVGNIISWRRSSQESNVYFPPITTGADLLG